MGNIQIELGSIIGGVFTALSVLIGGLVLLAKIKKDNQKHSDDIMEKAVTAALAEFKSKAEIQQQMALLEQKVDFASIGIWKEIKELKELIKDVYEKYNEHLTKHITAT